jgi:amidase
MIRDQEVSSVEVVDAYLEQIKKHNNKLNAIATLDAEKAIKRAKEADQALARGENWGALHGVPITVKDTFETAGLRTTAGYKPLRNHTPTQDATVVARLRQSGAILLGKTNLAEMASDYQSTNDLFVCSLNRRFTAVFVLDGRCRSQAARDSACSLGYG